MPGKNLSISLSSSSSSSMALPLAPSVMNIPPKLKHNEAIKLSTMQKICKVAAAIFKFILQFTVGAFFYWLNPTFFTIGVLTGIFLDDHVSKGIQKIKDVWRTQSLFACAVTIAGGYLALPVVMATGSLLGGGHLGSSSSLKAQRLLSK